MNLVKKTIYMMLLTVLGMVKGVQAQVSITSVGQTYSQNFNALPSSGTTTWSNNSTLTSWYAQRASGNGTISMYGNNGSSSTTGLYSYGTASEDRSLGSVPGSQGSESYYIGVRIKNNSGTTINAFSVSFSAEQWRVSGTKSQNIRFSYKTSSSSITSLTGNGWTSIKSLDFESPAIGTLGPVNGNSSSYNESKTYTITGVSLASGSEIMFRWYLPKKKNVNHGYSIDDFSVTALNPTIYYSKSTGALNITSTWGTSTNGTGTSPGSFSSSNCIFVISNNATPTLTANWQVSGTNSKVILGTGSAINFTIPSAYSFTGMIDVASSATLTVNNSTVPTLGSVAETSILIFNSSSDQNLPGGTYNNLTINGGGKKILTGDVNIVGTLTFTSGKIDLGIYDLTISSGASISGASSTNYIITSGYGSLVRQVRSNNTSVSYPVGLTTTYLPVTLSQPGSGTDDYFFVRAFSGIYSSYDANDDATGSSVTSHAVKNTWVIDEEITGGSSLNITLQWNVSDEGTSFTRNNCYVAHYTGGSWESSTSAAASGSGPYTRQLTGVTSFSPFSIIDNSSPLPVRLVSFSGKPGDAGNELEWITASEVNNKGFEIERRDELTGDFVFVGFVNGHGTTSMLNTYIYNDDVTSSAYYRLKQVDFDGRFEYSQVIYIDRSNVNSTFSSGNVSINIYPNPAVNSVSVEVADGADWELNVKLVDINGKEVNVPVQEKSADGRKLTLDVSAVRKGVYFIESVNGQNKLSQKLLIL